MLLEHRAPNPGRWLLWALLLLLAWSGGCLPRASRPADDPGNPKGGLVPLETGDPVRWERQLGPRRLALLIGIEQFADAQWRPLRYTGADVTALAARLNEPNPGRFDQVITLNSPEQTGRAAILAALDQLGRDSRDSRDTVLIYVSSHGTLAPGADGRMRRYLVTRDTQLNDVRGTGLSMDELRNRFSALQSERKVLILATCHSGEGKSALPPAVAEELRGTKGAFFVPPLEAVSRASVILGACAFSETAREDDRLGHDIYTYFLLEGLLKGDSNGDGAVTVSEAHEHARSRTYYFTGGRQRPYVESDILGQDPIVIRGQIRRTGQPVVFSYRPEWEGLRLLVDGQAKGQLPGSWPVEPGERRIVLAGPSQQPVLQRDVRLAPGQRLDLGSAPPTPPRWLRMGLQLGWQTSFRSDSGLGAAGSLPSLGVNATFSPTVAPWEVALGLTTGGGSLQTTMTTGSGEQQEVELQTLELSLATGVQRRWTLGALELFAGAEGRLAWLRRTLELPGLQRQDGGWSLGPGVTTGARLRVHPRLLLTFDLTGDYLPQRVDGTDRPVIRTMGRFGLATSLL